MDDLPDLQKVNNLKGIDYVLRSEDNSSNDAVYEVIKMDEQQPLNDPNCEHRPVLDGDVLGDSVSVKCANCPIGWYIHKDDAARLNLY